MNKSHITDEQVKSVLKMYWRADNPSKIFSNVDIPAMRRALEAAFPDTSTGIPVDQQPAAFGKLVVTEEMAEQINYAKDIREALQSFVDNHSIKPIAFADQDPPNGSSYWGFETHGDVTAYYLYHEYDCKSAKAATHWLPASALPIPEPIDAKEAAWREYCSDWRSVGVKANRLDFLAGYEAGQAGGK